MRQIRGDSPPGLSGRQAALTPVAVEAKLRQLVNDLARAQTALAEAPTSRSTPATPANEPARRAVPCEKPPKITRGRHTVAEQAAWVE